MIKKLDNALLYRNDEEQLLIEPWGPSGLRVRATQGDCILPNEDFGLLPVETEQAKIMVQEDGGAVISNGLIRCCISRYGVMSFYKGDRLVLQEYERNRYAPADAPLCSALELRPRMYEPVLGTDHYKTIVRFEANDDEKIFGMGQYQQPQLNLKGCILELAHRNSQISVPFMLSSLGYGFLWNNPAIGKATFGMNLTEWTSVSTRQIDYWITCADTPAEIERQYSLVTGRAPEMPDFALGFWQSKLRYQTQEELMSVAREYHRRQIPVSVIVADYFHWEHQGEWSFDPEYWPDPAQMVQELDEMGMKLMVSIWPTVEEGSRYFAHMREQGYLVRSEVGNRMSHLGRACYLDVTNRQATDFMWSKIKENYYDKGVRVFWLDEAEPEYTGYEYSNIRYSIGTDLEKGNLFPRYYSQMAWRGQKAAEQEQIVNLVRCAWVGSQRYGALVWSGDIESTFACLRNQLAAGLNISLAGIPWWTTDIGGFHGGDIHDPAFVELMIRWFQFGAFSPVFRLHGYREPQKAPLSNHGGGASNSGAENEVWSYGEEAYEIFTGLIAMRQHLHDYISRTMNQAHEFGQPVIRPVFYNVPDDSKAWEVEDQYFFGDDLLVCPVLYACQRRREVYLPSGYEWRNLKDGTLYQGSQTVEVDAPLDTIPVFVKAEKYEELRML